jgi:hypothetical protein
MVSLGLGGFIGSHGGIPFATEVGLESVIEIRDQTNQGDLGGGRKGQEVWGKVGGWWKRHIWWERRKEGDRKVKFGGLVGAISG